MLRKTYNDYLEHTKKVCHNFCCRSLEGQAPIKAQIKKYYLLLQAFRHILRHISRLGMKNGIGKTQIQGKLKLTQINTADHGPGIQKSICQKLEDSD